MSESLQKPIVRLIEASGRLTHRELAEAARINRGQLSNWLKEKGRLSEEKARALVRVLLEKLRDPLVAPASVLAGHTEDLDVLKRFVATDQAEDRTRIVPVDGPLPAGHPAFCMRLCEEELETEIRKRPFTIGIRGGPKTGKSTAVQWVVHKLRTDPAPVLLFDFAGFGETDALFPWLDRQAREQLPPEDRPSRLTGGPRFVAWVRDNLLRYRDPHGNSCATLVFDGVDRLPAQLQLDLTIALHALRNAKARDLNLRYVNLLLAFALDVTNKDRNDLMGGSTSILISSNVPRAGAIPEGALVRLVELRLRLPEQASNQVLDHLESRFAGHPWLIQTWMNAFVGTGEGAEQDSMGQADGVVADKLRNLLSEPRYKKSFKLPVSVRQKLEGAPKTDDGSEDPIVVMDLQERQTNGDGAAERGSPESWGQLADTALFFSGEDGSRLYCTRWIAEQLISQSTAEGDSG